MTTSIGSRIRELRESILKGVEITQDEFSKKIGIKQAHLSLLENNLRNPSSKLLLLIEFNYGVRKEWILNGEGEIFKPKSTIDVKVISKEDKNINKLLTKADYVLRSKTTFTVSLEMNINDFYKAVLMEEEEKKQPQKNVI